MCGTTELQKLITLFVCLFISIVSVIFQVSFLAPVFKIFMNVLLFIGSFKLVDDASLGLGQ